MTVSKYIYFAHVAFGDHMKNRTRQVTRFIVYLLLAWVMITMWRVVYENGYGPQGISLTDMSWYNGLAQMMFFLSPRIFAVVDDDIRSGNIAYFLTRPMPYIWMRFAEGVGALMGMLLVYFTVGLFFLYLMIGAWPDGGLIPLTAVLLGLVLSSVIHLMFQISCGLSAFWTQDAIFVYNTYQKLNLLLGGTYIPLMLYPSVFNQTFLHLTWSASLMNNPVSQLFAPVTFTSFMNVVGLQLIWLFIAASLATFIYQRCLRQIEVNGG